MYWELFEQFLGVLWEVFRVYYLFGCFRKHFVFCFYFFRRGFTMDVKCYMEK